MGVVLNLDDAFRGVMRVLCAPMPPIVSKFLPVCGLALALALGSCAIISSPKGGLVDRTPPVLDTLNSSPNFQLDARPREFVLEFDEYVVLKEASRNVILTPTPEGGKPTFVQRGRRVTVDLSDVVYRDSTTYQLQFGNTVQDLNEGNAAPGLRYVFSTGGYLDSLTLTGAVADALTGEPAIGALVGLYRSDADTVLAKAAPDYFTKTDSSGQFLLDYLSPGTYQLAAYLDENNNYRLNEGEEDLAFAENLVTVSAAAPDTSYVLLSSATYAPFRVLRGEQLFPGYLRLTLNRPAAAAMTLVDFPGEVVARVEDGDTLFVAYTPPLDSLEEVRVSFQDRVDTVALRRTISATPPPLRARGAPGGVPGETTLVQAFSAPVASIDLDSVTVAVDSTADAKGRFEVSPEDARQLLWRYPVDTVSGYAVRLLPGALRGFFGERNADTVAIDLRPRRATEFGQLTLTLDSLTAGAAYVLEVLGPRGDVERTLRIDSAAVTETRVLRRLPPETYTLRVTDDADRDGRYSPGDPRRRTQPERVRVYPIEQVRADWTVEQRVGLTP